MKLNKEQKQLLLKKGYVSAKMLDACVEEGWQDYFIENYTWELDLHRNWFRMFDLKLKHKSDKYLNYEGLAVNLKDKDLDRLLTIG